MGFARIIDTDSQAVLDALHDLLLFKVVDDPRDDFVVEVAIIWRWDITEHFNIAKICTNIALFENWLDYIAVGDKSTHF